MRVHDNPYNNNYHRHIYIYIRTQSSVSSWDVHTYKSLVCVSCMRCRGYRTGQSGVIITSYYYTRRRRFRYFDVGTSPAHQGRNKKKIYIKHRARKTRKKTIIIIIVIIVQPIIIITVVVCCAPRPRNRFVCSTTVVAVTTRRFIPVVPPTKTTNDRRETIFIIIIFFFNYIFAARYYYKILVKNVGSRLIFGVRWPDTDRYYKKMKRKEEIPFTPDNTNRLNHIAVLEKKKRLQHENYFLRNLNL